MFDLFKKVPVSVPVQPTEDKDFLALVRHAYTLKQQAESAARAFESANQQVLDRLKPGDRVTVPGVCNVLVSERQTMSIKDAGTLRQLLGERFEDLVEAKYKPTQKLVDLALKSQDRDQIMEQINISVSRQVRYSAERKDAV